jgi:excisionase family DNA binding protein
MLTIKQVAEALNVCAMTIMRHLTKGTIRGIKVGKSWRISQEELDRIKREGFWLKSYVIITKKEGCIEDWKAES